AFDIEVRDSGVPQKTLLRTLAVTAAADRFLFVAEDGADSVGRGSIDQPLRSIPYTLSQSDPDQVLMLRGGLYSGRFALLDGHARQIVAYPDEVPLISLEQDGAIDVRIDDPPAARIEGVDITGVRQYGIISDPSR